MPTAKYPKIRLITVPNLGTQEPQKDFKGKWEVCRPDKAAWFSAVGYLFGRRLHQTLGVPVGLINDAWGGSACEAWIRRDLLAADKKYAPLLDHWEQIEKDYPRAKAEYDTKRAAWEKEADQGQGRRQTGPSGAVQSRLGYDRQFPARQHLQWCPQAHDRLRHPGRRSGIKASRTRVRAYQYRDLFPLMIKSWRDEWGQGDFSFYWVQLADFMTEPTEPGESSWAELRKAQTMTLSRLPKTGEAVIIDIGEGQDIHPKNKQDVANRLARWALARDYGVPVAYQSPKFKAMEKHGNKVLVTFDHVGGGLKSFDVPGTARVRHRRR